MKESASRPYSHWWRREPQQRSCAFEVGSADRLEGMRDCRYESEEDEMNWWQRIREAGSMRSEREGARESEGENRTAVCRWTALVLNTMKKSAQRTVEDSEHLRKGNKAERRNGKMRHQGRATKSKCNEKYQWYLHIVRKTEQRKKVKQTYTASHLLQKGGRTRSGS